jgi:hypothetical protein
MEPYDCCRCGYQTKCKKNMRKHLFHLKKPCPTLKSMIELTDDIKNHILKFRKYHIQHQPEFALPADNQHHPQINQQNIQYININTNIVNQLNVVDKIEKYATHKKVEISNYDNYFEDKFEEKVRKLETDAHRELFTMTSNDLFEVVNDATNIKKVTDLNIIYDSKYDKIKLRECNSWTEKLVDSAVCDIVATIKGCYLDIYEVYLIRKGENPDTPLKKKSEIRDCLEEYYRFIAAFGIKSFVSGNNDTQIRYNNDDDGFLEKVDETDESLFILTDKYEKIYKTVDCNLSRADKNRTKRAVTDIIKNNSSRNLADLNKEIVSMIKADEDFRRLFL